MGRMRIMTKPICLPGRSRSTVVKAVDERPGAMRRPMLCSLDRVSVTAGNAAVSLHIAMARRHRLGGHGHLRGERYDDLVEQDQQGLLEEIPSGWPEATASALP